MQGIIFDLDGTLLDSMTCWKEMGSQYLKSRNIEHDSNISEKTAHLSYVNTVIYMKEAYQLEESVEEIIAQINQMIEHNYKFNLPLKPYVLHFLDRVKKKNYKTCIATATQRHLVELALRRLNLMEYFDFIITSPEVGDEKHTSPKIYEEALKKLGTTKENTIVFEDALHAVKTAKEAGFYVVAVSDATTKDQKEEIKAIADKYIRSFREFKLK